MSNEVLEKIKLLPPEKQQAVEDFVEYLLDKYTVKNPSDGLSLAEM